MNICLLTSVADLDLYQKWIDQRSHASLWQSLEWKHFQESLGRTVRIYAGFENSDIVCSALIVIDKTMGGFCTWEIPRGPIWRLENRDWRLGIKKLIEHITDESKKSKCISIYLSPYSDTESLISNPQSLISLSKRNVQPQATRIIDLTQSEEDILKQMKPKGRYNIKVAQKKGVTIKHSDDIEAFAHLHNVTASRNIFTNPGCKTYKAFVENIKGSFLLLAYQGASNNELEPCSVNLAPIAGLLGVIYENHAVYYYGASDYTHRAFMAPYALQWEAMQYCKAQGATSYDLFGIAPPESVHHPWAGITSFKSKFGGQLIEYPPEQEIVLRPMVKRLLGWKRKLLG